MSILKSSIAMSLDGFVAGPNQSEEYPIGEGGMALHEWAFALDAWRREHGQGGGETNASSEVIDNWLAGQGATIMGRNMFGPVRGDWGDMSWNGWWGDDPPFHHPVFVLTHHERDVLTLEGGNSFTFVTDGIESALEQARAAAGDKDVQIPGGASTVRQYLKAGLVDELLIHLVPIFLGSGERLFEDLGDLRLEIVRAVDAPGVTHITYRPVK